MIAGASCAIGSKLYFFGGWCNHGNCDHNSLHELDTDDYKWSLCLVKSDNGPIKKSDCGMVAIQQTLLVVGGIGSPPKSPQPLAQYDGEGLLAGLARTNEHHLHNLGTGKLRFVMTSAVCGCACRMFVCGWWMVEGWRMMEVVVVWRVGQVPVQQLCA